LARWASCTLATGVVSLVLAAGVGTAPKTHHFVVTISPVVVVPYLWASVSVSGLAEATEVDVRILGASDFRGDVMPWIPLHRRFGDWRARLSQPVLPGIYPIEVRERPALEVTAARLVYLRVYEPGTTAHPLFSTPRQVAWWWVTDVEHGTVVAMRRWPGTLFDHRLEKLHRLYVIAYTPARTSGRADRLGAWITVVREGYAGGWRLLAASVTPP